MCRLQQKLFVKKEETSRWAHFFEVQSTLIEEVIDVFQ